MKHDLKIAALLLALSGTAAAGGIVASSTALGSVPGAVSAAPQNTYQTANAITSVKLSSLVTSVGQPVKVTVTGRGQCAIMFTTMVGNGVPNEQVFAWAAMQKFPMEAVFNPAPDRVGQVTVWARPIGKNAQYNPQGTSCDASGWTTAQLTVNPGVAPVPR